MISTAADTATSQATAPPALPTAPPLPDPPQPTESAADVVAKADSILTSIHKFQRNLLDSKIANDSSMITYYQNQIGIYKNLLLVELNKLGAGDKLESLAAGTDSVGQLLPGAQFIDGKYQYSFSQIQTLLNQNKAQSELRVIGGYQRQAVTIPVTNAFGQSGTLVLNYIPPGFFYGGGFYTVAGVSWLAADSRTVAQQVAFDPAERIHAQPFQTGISVATRLGGLAQGGRQRG